MNRSSLLILFLSFLLLIGGCGIRQKYRVDEQPRHEDSNSEKSVSSNYRSNESGTISTDDLLRLGSIIQNYLGRPYSGKAVHGNGLDCSRFVQKVFVDFNGIDIPRTVKTQIQYGHAVNKGDLKYGDLVFFRTDGREVSHVGIYIGYNEFVHSSSSSGVIISELDNKYWKKKFVAARRVLR